MTDQDRTATAQSSNPSPEASPEETQEPLAIRRIRSLRRKFPEETPAQIAERIDQKFSRDFVLVGGAETGINHMIPGALNAATRNSRVANLTRAASQAGVVQNISAYTQKTAQGVSTAAHVGSSQSIKTYLFALALLHGRAPENADDAATEILGGDIHALLRTLDQPIAHEEGQSGVSPLNAIAAVAQIGARNPQMFLLVKSGEQLIRSGSSVMETTRARKEFAAALIKQAHEKLGELPADFPDDARLAPEEEPQELAPEQASDIGSVEPVEATSAEELNSLAESNTASARGARFAAKAFMAGSKKLRGWGQK
ncbi:hypothetical protein [Rothia aerolata]|uniref:Uncharacterized protein n=1 Tax=Rothia aerolata TaxID=1812262 RepID=A0A917MUT5_9MICC|nr:hypothetical protein [Rothia aerolata]GGH61772.1 hypothetical protein GCM10007359_11290 [Rothia aerolata]